MVKRSLAKASKQTHQPSSHAAARRQAWRTAVIASRALTRSWSGDVEPRRELLPIREQRAVHRPALNRFKVLCIR
jgi:hypothetical protein